MRTIGRRLSFPVAAGERRVEAFAVFNVFYQLGILASSGAVIDVF